MGFWSKLFGPSKAVLADPKAGTASNPQDDARPIIQPGSAIWRLYPEDGITPEKFKRIRRDADVGIVAELMELYDAVANDYQVGSQLRTRKLAVAGAPVEIEPGVDENATDAEKTSAQKIADDFEAFFDKIPHRTQFLSDILDDFYRGFSCVRPVWDSLEGAWQIVAHEAIESRYFYFENATDPRICEIPGSNVGVPVPPGYIYSEFRDKAGPCIRAAVGQSVGKMWIGKGYMFVDMQGYLEKHGSPHVQVNLSKNLREGDVELERIKSAARAFIADQIGIMPEGATLQVLEAVQKAATVKDVYIVAQKFCDEAISKAICGQVLTADAGPGGIGHGGAAEEQGDVRQDLKEADASRVQDVLRAMVAKPWTLYHYGPGAPVPKICIDVAKPEDEVAATLAQKQRAEAINILRSGGLEISKAQCYRDFDLEEPEDEDDTLPIPAAPPQATDVGDPAGGVPAPGSTPPGSAPKTPAK